MSLMLHFRPYSKESREPVKGLNRRVTPDFSFRKIVWVWGIDLRGWTGGPSRRLIRIMEVSRDCGLDRQWQGE